MNLNEIKKKLTNHECDERLRQCVAGRALDQEIDRYTRLIDQAEQHFGEQDWHLFSAPGRSEVGGNHTDHQRGRVLAASVNMDIAAAAAPCQGKIQLISEGFSMCQVDLDCLDVIPEERNTSQALIRGIAARFQQLGWKIGGFVAYCSSNVLPGSGISSSAAFEVLIGTILSHLYNDGNVDPIEIAKIGQYAENVYFQKPCGLLDQMACSVGGFVTIDFFDKENPRVEKVDFDFSASGYALCLVDTKGDHADLSEEYGLMPKEMKDVAHFFNKEVMSEVTMEELMDNLFALRSAVSDRAILRAFHFLNENQRVTQEVSALRERDIPRFLRLIIESGQSSFMYLQNVSSNQRPNEQALAVALAVSEQILNGRGAWRVHGGGLAGTIQAFVPDDLLEQYRSQMEKIFGSGSCFVLSIRPVGGVKIV